MIEHIVLKNHKKGKARFSKNFSIRDYIKYGRKNQWR